MVLRVQGHLSSVQVPPWGRACDIMTKGETLPSLCLTGSAKCFLSTRETSRDTSLLDCVRYCL